MTLENDIVKSFRYLLSFILFNIILYYIVYSIKIEFTIAQKIYSFTFFIQFVWILYVCFLIQHEKKIAEKYKYQFVNKENIDFERNTVLIQDYYSKNLNYLEEDYNLTKLSDQINIQKNELTITFSEYMHTSFHEFTNRQRVLYFEANFKTLSNENITDKIYACGFKSKSTFYKYFKLEFQQSPNEYFKINS